MLLDFLRKEDERQMWKTNEKNITVWGEKKKQVDRERMTIKEITEEKKRNNKENEKRNITSDQKEKR